MVDVVEKKDRLVYLCEICGRGYGTLQTAELCENFCDSNQFSSPEIIRKAVYAPATLVMY